jgi:YHS domain-containing protein
MQPPRWLFAAPLYILCVIGALWLVGCSSVPEREPQHADASTVTCHVCRYNNDLACVCVRVKETTPRAEYHGQTYFFCSEDCREAFLKKPQKYLPHTAAAKN